MCPKPEAAATTCCFLLIWTSIGGGYLTQNLTGEGK